MIHAKYRLIGMARIVVKTINDIGRSQIDMDLCLVSLTADAPLKPLRANHRGQQICEHKSSYNGRHVDHRDTSDLFASIEKRIAEAHRNQTQEEHPGKPDFQIHYSSTSVDIVSIVGHHDGGQWNMMRIAVGRPARGQVIERKIPFIALLHTMRIKRATG
jgi:hypothetical protein